MQPLRILTPDDLELAMEIIGSTREPDLVIAPDGEPYLYRWYIIPRRKKANVYLHLQIDSDPERPLHDHPWANTSVILSGGYDEIFNRFPWLDESRQETRTLRVGDVVHRPATLAHRLILPLRIPYTMTLFTTGPVVRDWGFWFPDGWRNADTVTSLDPETRMSIIQNGEDNEQTSRRRSTRRRPSGH